MVENKVGGQWWSDWEMVLERWVKNIGVGGWWVVDCGQWKVVR